MLLIYQQLYLYSIIANPMWIKYYNVSNKHWQRRVKLRRYKISTMPVNCYTGGKIGIRIKIYL